MQSWGRTWVAVVVYGGGKDGGQDLATRVGAQAAVQALL